MTVKALKAFKDILPDESPAWRRLEDSARDVFARFGVEEIRTPVLEQTGLFARSIGEETDIVAKEMYTFADKNGASVTMRPEGTASVLRAFIEHGLHLRRPVSRLFTMGPMFRHERPQMGRLRQFHQISVEYIGSGHPLVDVEVMAMAHLLLQESGLRVRLEMNSLGCPACRPRFRDHLTAFLKERGGDSATLCDDCVRRTDTNPLRVLDCKKEPCRQLVADAPSILDHLCDDCAAHLNQVKNGLTTLEVPFAMNPFMVRGLDYYCRTTFEFITDNLGAQSAVGAGGRYDGLVRQLGGQDLPGIGFAMGMERLLLLLEQQDGPAPAAAPALAVLPIGDGAVALALPLVHRLRADGVAVAADFSGKSLKSQMKQAGKLDVRTVCIIGDDELHKKEAVLRDMASGEQTPVSLAGTMAEIARRIGTNQHGWTIRASHNKE